MAQGRIILQTLGSSKKFAALGTAAAIGEFAQILYPLLVTHADEFGRLCGDAFGVKYSVFPTSPRPEEDFDLALDAMARVGLILRYRVGDTLIVQIGKFEEGQPGLRKDRRGKRSRFADPPGVLTPIETVPETPGDSRRLPETPTEGREGRKEGRKINTYADGGRMEDFWEFWREAMGRLRRASVRLQPNAKEQEQMIDLLTRYPDDSLLRRITEEYLSTADKAVREKGTSLGWLVYWAGEIEGWLRGRAS